MATYVYQEKLKEFEQKYGAITGAGYKTQGSLYDSVIIRAGVAPNADLTFFVEPMGTGTGGQGVGGIKTIMDTNMQQQRRLPNATGFLIHNIGFQMRYGTAKTGTYQPAFTNLATQTEIQLLHANGYQIQLYFQQLSNYQFSELFELIPSISGFSGATADTTAVTTATGAIPGWGAYRLTDTYNFLNPYPLMENDTFQVKLHSDLAAQTALHATLDVHLKIVLLGEWRYPFA